MRDKIFEIFSEVFEIPLSEVNESMSQENFDNWDSIMHLTLISELEMAFDISLEPEDIENMNSLTTVQQVISSKKALI